MTATSPGSSPPDARPITARRPWTSPRRTCRPRTHLPAFVVPGMANGHSHAFQRGMAGQHRISIVRSGQLLDVAARPCTRLANRDIGGRGPAKCWRRSLFIEMLKSGYTTVAEFHYLHRQTSTARHCIGASERIMGRRNRGRRGNAGIGLTFLPTLYQTSDFGGQAAQARAGTVRPRIRTRFVRARLRRRISS